MSLIEEYQEIVDDIIDMEHLYRIRDSFGCPNDLTIFTNEEIELFIKIVDIRINEISGTGEILI